MAVGDRMNAGVSDYAVNEDYLGRLDNVNVFGEIGWPSQYRRLSKYATWRASYLDTQSSCMHDGEIFNSSKF